MSNASPTPTTIEINGFAVREIRKIAGFNATPFAAEVGITQPHLSKIETGTRTRVTPHTFNALLRALAISDRRALLANPHVVLADVTEADAEVIR